MYFPSDAIHLNDCFLPFRLPAVLKRKHRPVIQIHVGYLPNHHLIGHSKIPRIVEMYAKAGHAALAARMPVHVVTDAELGLKGSALLAEAAGGR